MGLESQALTAWVTRLIVKSVLGKLPICDVVKLFDGSLLQELKSECGGIQTLLRNSSQIFQGMLNSSFYDRVFRKISTNFFKRFQHPRCCK